MVCIYNRICQIKSRSAIAGKTSALPRIRLRYPVAIIEGGPVAIGNLNFSLTLKNLKNWKSIERRLYPSMGSRSGVITSFYDHWIIRSGEFCAIILHKMKIKIPFNKNIKVHPSPLFPLFQIVLIGIGFRFSSRAAFDMMHLLRYSKIFPSFRIF